MLAFSWDADVDMTLIRSHSFHAHSHTHLIHTTLFRSLDVQTLNTTHYSLLDRILPPPLVCQDEYMEMGKKYGVVSHCWELSVLQQEQARATEEETYLRMIKVFTYRYCCPLLLSLPLLLIPIITPIPIVTL